MAPFDERVVVARLEHLVWVLELIERDAPSESSELLGDADSIMMHGLELRLVTAVQCVSDIAAHLCLAERLGRDLDYADSIRVLGLKGFIESDLAERLAAAVGLRNVIVHQYLDVDPACVISALASLDDLWRFASAIRERLSLGE